MFESRAREPARQDDRNRNSRRRVSRKRRARTRTPSGHSKTARASADSERSPGPSRPPPPGLLKAARENSASERLRRSCWPPGLSRSARETAGGERPPGPSCPPPPPGLAKTTRASTLRDRPRKRLWARQGRRKRGRGVFRCSFVSPDVAGRPDPPGRLRPEPVHCSALPQASAFDLECPKISAALAAEAANVAPNARSLTFARTPSTRTSGSVSTPALRPASLSAQRLVSSGGGCAPAPLTTPATPPSP